MQQHIQVFSEGVSRFGLINICNIEEVWLNENSNSVAIRYLSPNGKLVDHEEYFSNVSTARKRYLSIARQLIDEYDNQYKYFECDMEITKAIEKEKKQ